MATLPAFVTSFLPPAQRPPVHAVVSSSASSFVAPLPSAASQIGLASSRRRHAPAPRMAFGLFSTSDSAASASAQPTTASLFSFFRRKEVVAIPQKDVANAAKRAAAVEDAQATYEWKHEGIGDAAMVKSLPIPEELPALGWLGGLVEILVKVALNGLAEDVDTALEGSIIAGIVGAVSTTTAKIVAGQATADDLFAAIKDVAKRYVSSAEGVGRTLDDYKDLFNTIKLDTVAKKDQFLQDDIFGWYRVAGPNPMKLTKLASNVGDMFPGLTDAVFAGVPGFAGDSLAAAAREHRLYFVDYAELDGIPTGKIDGKVKDTFMYAPRCLLAVPRNRTVRTPLLPIAIRCGQDTAKHPLFTANPEHTDSVTWLAAKYTVQASDALVHESVFHLGRCHLLEEAMLVSMYRSLPPSHPLYRLLKPSFYGTALINAAAVSTLISDGGIIDRITAPDIETTRVISANAITDPSFRFNDWMPDVELPARGVTQHPDVLDFPYRDDALRHWAAVNTFVEQYVRAYYVSDADVQGDHELQRFCEEVTQNGRIHGFGDSPNGHIHTRDYLVRAVSMIMFTASVQHAAVNYPQSTLMQFTPAMPLAGAAPAPMTPRPYKSVDEWVNSMVPVLPQAETQLQTAETIGVLRYGMVGEYGKTLDFAPDVVGEALEEYQEQLAEMGAMMMERNKKQRLAGLPVYNFLVPKNVPLSINI